ncbi:hypothetical protein Tco_1053540 [Tanacetum coccineum]|uniref:Uncharacterized protein n=1 Tax=Tanacetum coccineum TaxID=301880 RepID=A0ABQ5GU66_9ASTR
MGSNTMAYIIRQVKSSSIVKINPDSVDKNDPKDVQLEDEDIMLNDDDVIVVLHEDAQATFGDTNDPFTFISMSKDLADKRIKILQLMMHINS